MPYDRTSDGRYGSGPYWKSDSGAKAPRTIADLYDGTQDGALAFLYGTDHAQTASGFLAKALWLLGHPDAAAARESWATAHALKVNHLFSLVQAAMFRTTVRLFARDWEGAAIVAQEILELATRHSLRFASTFADFCLAACQAARCADRATVERMRVTAEAWGHLNYRPFFLGLIAEAQALSGDPDGGLRVLTEARSVVDATDERWIEPELCRLIGELKLMRNNRPRERRRRHFEKESRLPDARRRGASSCERASALRVC